MGPIDPMGPGTSIRPVSDPLTQDVDVAPLLREFKEGQVATVGGTAAVPSNGDSGRAQVPWREPARLRPLRVEVEPAEHDRARDTHLPGTLRDHRATFPCSWSMTWFVPFFPSARAPVCSAG